MDTIAAQTDKARKATSLDFPRAFLSLLVALVAALTAPALATAHGADEKELTPMEKSMETLEDAFRNLRRALRSPDPAQKDDYLQYVKVIKTEALRSRDYVPQLIEELPEAEKARALKAYLESMDQFVEMIGKLEAAVQETQWEAAEAAIRSMRKAKSDGHKQFKKDE